MKESPRDVWYREVTSRMRGPLKKVEGPPAGDFAPDSREVRHRLLPQLGLESPEEAQSFIRKMGIVSLQEHPYLPSLKGAIHGKPRKKVFKNPFDHWPKEAWWWGGVMHLRGDILAVKGIGDQTFFLPRRSWPAYDAAVRGRASKLWYPWSEYVGILWIYAPMSMSEAVLTSGINEEEYAKVLKTLHGLGSLIIIHQPGNPYEGSADVHLWEKRFPKPLTEETGRVDGLVRLIVSAAGEVPQRAVPPMFGWPQKETLEAIERLVASGSVTRDARGRLHAPDEGESETPKKAAGKRGK